MSPIRTKHVSVDIKMSLINYSDEGLQVGQRRSKRQATSYEPHKATCPSSRDGKQVCCLNIKKEPIFQEKCSESAGYECLPITKCNLENPVAQAESESEVLDIRSSEF